MDDAFAGVVDERGASGEAARQYIHLKIPLDNIWSHASLHCNIRPDDVVTSLILRLDLNDWFIPYGCEELKEAEGIDAYELG